MAMESYATAVTAGWITFVIVLVLILLLSWLYVRHYTHRRDAECSVTTVATLSLCTVFLTNALIPVDIFLVSYMKNDNGTFKDWAEDNSTRKMIEDDVLYAYYALYGLVILFMFILLPLMYFYHEEREELDPSVTVPVRCLSAVKFVIGFVFMAGVLLLIGALIPLKGIPDEGKNATDWKKFQFLFDELKSTRFEDAISFTISCISVLGLLTWIIYTSYGMSYWPISLIRGKRSASTQHLEVVDERNDRAEQINAIKRKYEGDGGGRRMSARDRRRLTELEESEHLLSRQERHLAYISLTWTNKCRRVARPASFIFGLLFMLCGALIVLSLLLVNIDKALHSLGYEVGYALSKPKIPNPLDIVLVFCQQVFPLDYVIMCFLVLFLVCCTMSALRQIGIWCCWLRMYRLRAHRTRPQGVLLVIAMLMLFALMLNVMILSIAPQYATYGNQHYRAIINATTSGNGTITHTELRSCNSQATIDDCTMTRMSVLLLTYFYKAWFFGTVYYWGSWIILGLYPIGLLVSVVKRRQSAIAGYVEESDLDTSDDDDDGPLMPVPYAH